MLALACLVGTLAGLILPADHVTRGWSSDPHLLPAWEPKQATSTPLPPPSPQIVLTQVITPVADSWYEVDVGTGAPVNATPQGASLHLSAGWSDTGIDEHAALRFAVPTSMPDTRLARAELELAIDGADIYVFDPPRQIVSGTMLVRLRDVETAWMESSLSSLEPPNLGPVGQQTELPWGPCDAQGCGIARIDLLEHLRSRGLRGWLPDHGFSLQANGVIDRPTFGTFFQVASRESDRPPRLHLAWEAIPLNQPPTVTPTAQGSATASPTGTQPPTVLATSTRTPSAEPSTTLGPNRILLPFTTRP